MPLESQPHETGTTMTWNWGFMEHLGSSVAAHAVASHALTSLEKQWESQYIRAGNGESLGLNKTDEPFEFQQLDSTGDAPEEGSVTAWKKASWDGPKRSFLSPSTFKDIPTIDWKSLQDPVFTNVVRTLLQRVWAIIISKALRTRFPLDATFVSQFEDPVAEERKAVLNVHCNATAIQAFAFWKSLEEDFQNFLTTLRGNDRETFRRKLDLRIHWR